MIDVEQLALQRSRYPELSDADFRFMLQQVDGRQRTAHKLPSFAALEDWWYPVRLSCEQCSSEITARYKALIISTHPLIKAHAPQDITCTDLTGGYGIDSFFLSRTFGHICYVERNAELCRIAEHNFTLYAPNICVRNANAEAHLAAMSPCHVLFLDPARRDRNGGKVFRLEDCEPDITQLLPVLHSKSQLLLFKLSPMLDITAALRTLGNAIANTNLAFDIHILAVDNEVKELLFISAADPENPVTTAVNISVNDTDFSHLAPFTIQQNQQSAPPAYAQHIGTFLYEPNAAILKAGMYNAIATRFRLAKLAPNTHLYTSDTLLPSFPGRIWRVIAPYKHDNTLHQCNILTRNYPLTPDQLKKKFRLHDGGNRYLIGARLADKPVLLIAERVN